MAKSTTTTKAKTQTSKKKPATRTAAAKTIKTSLKIKTTKPAAAKAKKPSASKAFTTPVKKAEIKKAAVNKTQASRRFHTGYLFAAFILAAQAIAAGLLMKTDSAQIFLGGLTKNELASRTGTVLVSAAHPLYEIEFRWLLVVILGVSALFALLRGTKFQAREAAGIKLGVQPLRWIDFAVTGALLFQLVALLNGLQDAVAIKLGMISIAFSAYFAWMYERENAATGKPAKASLIGARLTLLFPALALVGTAIGSYVYGMVHSPWYSYAALAVFVVGLTLSVNKLKLTTNASKGGYLDVDGKYTVHNVLFKVVLATVVIVGLATHK